MPLFAWLLNLIYLLFAVVVAPVLLYRMLRQGKYRDGWAQKFLGRLPIPPGGDGGHSQRIWFHAVSVGEVLQLESLLRELERQRPEFEFVISTTTVTGFAVAQTKYPQHHVCYFPLDFSWAVRTAVQRIQPAAVVLVELELWPNFIREVHRRGIPLLLINGRMSEKSYRGYRRIRPLMKRLLTKFDRLAVQNESYAARLIDLGAPAERVSVCGSIKFDGIAGERNNARTVELRAVFGLVGDAPVFIAGSTHAPEEEIALAAWLTVRKQHPDLRLILIPRHRERFEEVARLVASKGLPLKRRTETEIDSDVQKKDIPPVLLLDTLGELSACWGLADIAFVGGSLTRRGGQNMIEPAAYGAAVLFGPNTGNFRDVVEILLAADAARVVNNESELAKAIADCLNDRNTAREQGRRARDVVLSQQGAVAKTVATISRILPDAGRSMRKAG